MGLRWPSVPFILKDYMVYWSFCAAYSVFIWAWSNRGKLVVKVLTLSLEGITTVLIMRGVVIFSLIGITSFLVLAEPGVVIPVPPLSTSATFAT